MKNINKNCPYGYKVGYRENGSRHFIRYIVTNTYDLAAWHVEIYKKTTVYARKDNHKIINPIWEIIPLKHIESILVWRDCPF